jgi:SAM-dependent methyltransferase
LTPPAASGPLSALFHDARRARAPDREVAWYAARLPRDAGTQLDAMCGSGRLLVPLVEAGFGVHGVDQSEPRLASARAKLGATSRSTQLFRQNVTALNLPFRYAAAFMGAGVFQRLADRVAALDVLLRLRAHLVEPGILLIDLVIPARALHPPGAPVIEVGQALLDDGSRIACRSETTVDAAGRTMRIQRRFERRERGRIIGREDEVKTMTWYSEEQIATLMGDAGYRDIVIEPFASAGDDARRFAVSARA